MLKFSEQKRAIVEALLPLCPFLLVDGTHKQGQHLPPVLVRSDLVLRLGRDAQVLGMPDLVLTDEGFSATLSLQGVRHHVTVPWAAVHRCWVGEPFVGPLVAWPNLEPDDEIAQEPTKPDRPSLRVVKS